MRVLIAGANGRTGRRLIPLLLRNGQTPVAMIRHDSQAKELEALGAETIVGDLEYPLDHCVKKADAVIFAAGSGSKTGKDKTILVDQLGAIRLATTAEFAGVRRFVMISAIGASPSSNHPKIAHYMKAKGHADDFLRERDLDWTIIKPGPLSGNPGTGRISISQHFGHTGETSLDNLAQATCESLSLQNLFQKEFQMLDGDQPIAEALRAYSPQD